jgi:hypothetical protein
VCKQTRIAGDSRRRRTALRRAVERLSLTARKAVQTQGVLIRERIVGAWKPMDEKMPEVSQEGLTARAAMLS